jgi:hypothetical protein
MGFPTKVQLINRANSEQWYINFPAALAQACEFVRGEVVEWVVKDQRNLLLRRAEDPASTVASEPKKKPPSRNSSAGRSRRVREPVE